MLPDRAEKIPEYVRNFIRQGEGAKSARIAFCDLAERYYEGQQWFRYDPSVGRVWPDPEVLNGMIDNYFKNILQRTVVAMTKRKFVPDVIASSNSATDHRAAMVAKTVLFDNFMANGGFTSRKRRAFKTALYGDAFTRVEVDRTILSTVILSPEEMQAFAKISGQNPVGPVMPHEGGKVKARFMLGDVVERDVHPSSFLLPLGIEDFNQAQNFALVWHAPVENIRNVAQSLGFSDPEKIQPVSSNDYRRPNVSGQVSQTTYYAGSPYINSFENYIIDQQANMGVLVEYWERSGGWWRAVYLTGQDYGMYLGGTAPTVMHPYTKYTCWPLPNKPWGGSQSINIVRHQNTHNKLLTQCYNWLRKSLKSALIMAPGTQIVGATQDEAADIVISTNNPGGIQRITGDTRAIDAYKERMNDNLKTMFEVGYVSDFSRGAIPDRASPDVIAMAMEIENGVWDDVTTRFNESDSEMQRRKLYLYQNDPVFTIPRLASWLGPDGKVEAAEFMDVDITGSMTFSVKAMPPEVKSPKDLYEYLPNLIQQGFFAPEAGELRRSVQDWVETGRVADVRTVNEKLQENWAISENRFFEEYASNPNILMEVPTKQPDAEGNQIEGPPQLVDMRTGEVIGHQWDNDDLHVEMHMRFVMDSNKPRISRDLAERHVNEFHQPRIQQAQKEAEENQIKMMSQQSLAENAGNLLATRIANDADETEREAEKAPSTPAQGGRNSGKTRRKE